MGYYEPSWGHLGAIWGPSWSHLGAILCHLGALLGLPWPILGPPWGHLWGYLGSSQGPLEGLFGPRGAIMGHCVVVLGLISDLGGCKFNYSARNVLPLHIQSTSIRYSPFAFRFIAGRLRGRMDPQLPLHLPLSLVLSAGALLHHATY